MARTGLGKSEVRKARDSLVAQSQYPSVDAVRIALGNTGSKTTIHKYLKELDEEEVTGATRKATVSDALQDLVERLAARLHEEADIRINQITAEHQAKELALEAEVSAARQSNAALDARLRDELGAHAKTQASLQSETIARHTADQQVKSLQQQVQRMQADLRQQQLTLNTRQDEVKKLSQESARLTTELSHTKQTLFEQLTQGRKLEQRIELLQSQQAHAGDLERQLANRIAETESLTERLKDASAGLEPERGRVRELELLLAQANAKAQAQEQIGEQLRIYLDTLTSKRKK